MRIIKRYKNRKLYDTSDSRYITLQEISQFIASGEEFKVIDNSTGEDITSTVLSQIIYESEKKRKKAIPVDFLKKIIQYGGEGLSEILEKLSILEKTGFKEAEKKLKEIVKIGEGSTEAGKAKIKELISSAQSGAQELEKKFDEAVQDAIQRIPGFGTLIRELKIIKQELEEVKRELKEMKKKGKEEKN